MATTERNGTERNTKGRAAQDDARKGGLSNFTVLAGATAAGAALGVLAMIGRKAAVQAPTYLAGNWADALAAEHAATLKIFDALEATDSSNTTKRSILLTQMKHALAKHALQEENAVYPSLREHGMVEGADELNAEHGYVKQYLYELENLPKDSSEFLPKLAKFRADIEDHMREEEQDLFPKLRGKLSEEGNKKLTNLMNKEGFKLA